MTKLTWKAVSLLVSMLGGAAAGAIFKQVWKFARHEDDAPEATDTSRGWAEILLAAAIQGAIFGLVKAVLDRMPDYRVDLDGVHRYAGNPTMDGVGTLPVTFTPGPSLGTLRPE